jgi:parallel beta-helix repeat protein
MSKCILVFIAVFLSMLSVGFSYTNISSCGTYGSGEFRLNTSFSQAGAGDCVIFNSDNVNLNCQWNTIMGIGADDGIYTNSVDNVTIQNCIVSNFSLGIYSYNTKNSTFENIITNNNTNHGFRFQGSHSNITNITSKFNTNFGVYVKYSGTGTYFKDLVIYNNTYGIKQENSGYIIYNNIIISNSSNTGISFSNGNWSKVNGYISRNNGKGLLSYNSYYLLLTNLDIKKSLNSAIVFSNVKYSNVTNSNFINNTGSSGIHLYASTHYNLFFENIVLNNTYDIYMDYSSDSVPSNNTFYNNVLGNTTTYNFLGSNNYTNFFSFGSQGNTYTDNSSFVNNCFSAGTGQICDLYQQLYSLSPESSTTKSVFPSFSIMSLFLIFILVITGLVI